MVTTKACSHSVGTSLSILTRETRGVEGSDEPIGWLLQAECGQLGCELRVVTTTVARCFGPLPPLLLPLLLIQRLIKTPDLTIFFVMALDGEVRCHPRRRRPIQKTGWYSIVT